MNQPRRPSTADRVTWRRTRLGLRAACVLCIVASLSLPAGWIESLFSGGLFPLTQSLLVPVSGAVPVPITGIVILLLPILLVVLTIRAWRSAGTRGIGRWRRLGVISGHGLRLALYIYTAFLLVWGVGYRRVPVEQRWGLSDRLASLQEVADLRARLVVLIRRDCVDDSQRDRQRARRSIEVAQAELVEQLEGFRPVWPRHIKSPPDGILMAFDVSGVVSPWTLEAHVESALPDPHWLATCGHELAHLAGYCGEADANLVGFVSGLRADDPFARYSTALRLFTYTASKQEGMAGYFRDYMALPNRARQDLSAARKVRKQFVVKRLKQVSSKVYHRYLKSQGVKAGTGDYARGFRLFVLAVAKGLVPLP